MTGAIYEPSGKCLALLTGRLGGREAAITALLDALVGGAVRAFGHVKDGDRSSLRPVMPTFWQAATDEDRRSWSWAAGTFEKRLTLDTAYSFVLPSKFERVEFDRSAIDELWPSSKVDDGPHAATVASSGTRRGPKRKLEWNDWVAALALVAADGKIVGTLTQTELLKLVADRMAESELDEVPRATVQSAVERVLEAFRGEGIWS